MARAVSDALSPTLPELPGEPIPNWVGHQVDGHQIEELLGQGGMGRVYKALDRRLGRHVAIKTVVAPMLHREEFFARFAREARVLSQVRHPNVAQIYSAGEFGGVPYYAMELIEGEALDRVLEDGRRLAGNRCLTYLMEAAAGLQEAHRQGLVHRDVKPSNLMIDANDHLKLVDFGLARRIDEGDSVTRTQSVMGTPRYMAPEQIMGQPLDHRSDIYSLGSTFYHLFCGEPPFPGSDPLGVGIHHLQTPLTPLRERNPRVPAPVEAIIGRMMAKSPDDRYQTYGELIEDLRRAQRGLPPRFARVATSPPRPISAEEVRRRNRLLLGAAGTLAVVMLVAILVFGGDSGAPPPNPPSRRAPSGPAVPEATRPAGNPAPNEVGPAAETARDREGEGFSPLFDPVEEAEPMPVRRGEPAAVPDPEPADPEPFRGSQNRADRQAPPAGPRDPDARALALAAAQALPTAESFRNLQGVATRVSIYMVEFGEVPDRLGEMMGQHAIPPQYLADGWGRSILYEPRGRDHYRLSSAGPDGVAGNEDDLVLEDGRVVQAPQNLLGLGEP